jgi:threonine/homoserine/homoserine lactone efflux protein
MKMVDELLQCYFLVWLGAQTWREEAHESTDDQATVAVL